MAISPVETIISALVNVAVAEGSGVGVNVEVGTIEMVASRWMQLSQSSQWS